jgi:hypothetical protein
MSRTGTRDAARDGMVVETGMSAKAANPILTAPPMASQEPLKALSLVILVPSVLTMYQVQALEANICATNRRSVREISWP